MVLISSFCSSLHFQILVHWNSEYMSITSVMATNLNVDLFFYRFDVRSLRGALYFTIAFELITTRGVVFHHDAARPYISLTTWLKLKEFDWEVRMHPPNSPDLAPCDYHLFRDPRNSLIGVKLGSKEACKKHLTQFAPENLQRSTMTAIWFYLRNGWKWPIIMTYLVQWSPFCIWNMKSFEFCL